ncbi:MAG: 5-bromo-4-chloroindolyl phosphate hydrolysis family protein [Oscillospiraceae bacterium]|nr:5-bromo-4-chloroindolyl phosphate hydrolysis family protein [Oscillospiraceae bacterium]
MATTAKKTGKPVAPFYAVAAIWLGYSFMVGLHGFWDFLIVIVLSVVAFRWLNTASAADEDAAEKPEEKKEPETTGNAELDKMIRDGELAISEMRRLNDSIEDEKISADIESLEKSSKAIFEQVKASPDKLPQIRKFMDYYLPTTLKLLNAYDRMSATGISGENIDTTKTKVETMMAREGFTGERMEAETTRNADGTDIKLEM